MFRNKSVDAYNCGEPGDLYAWNATSWKNEKSNTTVKITKQIKQLVCANKAVLILPAKTFNDSLKNCSAVTGGNLFNVEHAEFLEIIRQHLEPKVNFWLPFTYKEEEGSFVNIYTNSSFNNSLFFPFGRPGPSTKENYVLSWLEFRVGEGYMGGAMEEQWMVKTSLCEPEKQPRSLKIRGLCSASYIDKEYRPTMHPSGKSIIWIGSGVNKAVIQYSEETSGLILKTLDTMVYAQINISNSGDLIGKHEWTIFNDTRCSTEFSYKRNVSLR